MPVFGSHLSKDKHNFLELGSILALGGKPDQEFPNLNFDGLDFTDPGI